MLDLRKPNERQIRIFISSTFLDMQLERDELMKFAFPRLRKLCDERDVTLTTVDLRWGITADQVHRGEVLPRCLAEIECCRPYFIALLGQRYGWIPDELPEQLTVDFPWVRQYPRRSVTEIEIVSGALSQPNDRAWAYFRDPKYLETIPDGQRSAFVENDSNARTNLEDLKNRIRSSSITCDNYVNPQELSELVVSDLTRAINEDFPIESQLTPLQRERGFHQAFGRSRCKVYIGERRYFAQIDELLESTAQSLAVVGEAGSGKSALLANWAHHYTSANPTALVLYHSVGASPTSSDWSAMLRRLIGELQASFGVSEDIPDDHGELRIAFDSCLRRASEHCDESLSILPDASTQDAHVANHVERHGPTGLVLVIDGLNDLDDREGARELLWLPRNLPKNLRLVSSTLPGTVTDEITKRKWPTVEVQPLDEQERAHLISLYLAQYRKELSDLQVRRIIACNNSANPLFLTALLEELRLFGIHERLDERIAHYLASASIIDLYDRILERFEQDYERDHLGLVRGVMSMIACSRYGLTEQELLELLGQPGDPLPHSKWSPLYLATQHCLIGRSGLIGFFHAYLRDAVRARYLSDNDIESSFHLALADYFESDGSSRRRLEEFPWQLHAARCWDRLRQSMRSVSFIDSIYSYDRYDAMIYWKAIEDHGGISLDQDYPHIFAAFESFATQLQASDTAEERSAIVNSACEYAQSLTPLSEMAAAIGKLKFAERIRKAQDRALITKDPQAFWARLATDGKRTEALAKAAGDSATAFKGWEFPKLMAQLTNNEELQAEALIHQCGIRLNQQRIDEARSLIAQCRSIVASTENRELVRAFFSASGNLEAQSGNLEGALGAFEEEERLCQDLGRREALAGCWINQATTLAHLNRHEQALPLLRKAAQELRSLGFREHAESSRRLSTILIQVATNRLEGNDVIGMLQALIDGMSAARGIEYKEGVQAYQQIWMETYPLLANGTTALMKEGDTEGAEKNQRTLIRACRSMGDAVGLQRAMIQMAQMLHQLDRSDDALKQLKEQYEIAVQVKTWSLAVFSMCQQAGLIHTITGDTKQSMDLFRRAKTLSEKHHVTEHDAGIEAAMALLGEG